MRNSKSKNRNKKILIIFIFFLIVLSIVIASTRYEPTIVRNDNKENRVSVETVVTEVKTTTNATRDSLDNQGSEQKVVEEKKSTEDEVSEEQNHDEEKEIFEKESGQSVINIDYEENSVLELLGIEDLPKDALAVIINNPSEEILNKVSNLEKYKYQESNESSLIIPIYNDLTIKVVTLEWDGNLNEGEVLYSSEKSTNGFGLHVNADRPCGIPSLKIKIEGNGIRGEYTLAFNGKDGTPDVEYIDINATEEKNSTVMTSSKKKSYKVPKEAPEIQITILNSDPSVNFAEVVPSIILLNQWDGCMFDRASSLQAINMEYKEGEEVPKGKVGWDVIIDFGEYKPETIKLRKEYRIIYENLEDIITYNVPILNDEGAIYSFKLSKNKADAPTNQYVFTITANWGENSTDYAFCIKVEDK